MQVNNSEIIIKWLTSLFQVPEASVNTEGEGDGWGRGWWGWVGGRGCLGRRGQKEVAAFIKNEDS